CQAGDGIRGDLVTGVQTCSLPIYAQTFVGKYSLDSLSVDGKWIRIAVWPADAYSAGVRQNMRADLEKIAKTENALFAGPPYAHSSEERRVGEAGRRRQTDGRYAQR